MVELGDHKEALKDNSRAFLKMTRERAKTSANMLRTYSDVGDLQKAYEILEGMSALGDHEDMIQFRADVKDFLDSKNHQGLDSQVV